MEEGCVGQEDAGSPLGHALGTSEHERWPSLREQQAWGEPAFTL